jgi:RimJ/RimL family protein N-acetyltransferase
MIRLINDNDLDNLLKWKNDNKNCFFYKDIIPWEEHLRWYSEYRERKDDYMFVVECDGVDVGCMGIRAVGNWWDVYNIILGIKEYERKGIMSHALREMIDFALAVNTAIVRSLVLKSNPVALAWYFNNGFILESNHNEYLRLRYRRRI